MVWIRNQSPTKAVNGKTPYEALYGEKPTLEGTREWGSPCWVTKKTSKIHEWAMEGRWIGFDDSSKGHRVYWPARRTISVEHNVNFTRAPDPPLLEGEIEDSPFNFENSDDSSDEPTEPPTEVENQSPVPTVNQGNQDAIESHNPGQKQPKTTNTVKGASNAKQPAPAPALNPEAANDPILRIRTRRPWHKIYHDQTNVITSRLQNQDKTKTNKANEPELEGELGQEELAMATAIAFHKGMEPQTIQEVSQRMDKLQWEEAMKEEIEKLIRRNTWKVMETRRSQHCWIKMGLSIKERRERKRHLVSSTIGRTRIHPSPRNRF